MAEGVPQFFIEYISEDDLTEAARTLKTAAFEYHSGSDENRALIEAMRLLMVEIATRHGDDAWERADKALSSAVVSTVE